MTFLDLWQFGESMGAAPTRSRVTCNSSIKHCGPRRPRCGVPLAPAAASWSGCDLLSGTSCVPAGRAGSAAGARYSESGRPLPASAPRAPQGDCMDADRTAPGDIDRHLVVPAGDPPVAVPIVAVPDHPDRNPAAVYLAGKPSATGRRGLQRSLDRAAELLTGGLAASALVVNWAEVRYQHVMALRSVLIDADAKPATINHVLAAVRGTLREAWRLGLIDAESLARVVDVGNVSASTLPAGRHVDVAEVRRLFETCGDKPGGARDAAMLALLYGCGLRRSEAVALLLDDYDHGKVTVRSGKGRKERIVYCPAGGREAINAWIARRGLAPGALLNPVNKAGHIQHRPMTAQAVLLRLHYLADQAGVSRFSPHDLRRSFVGELLDVGADISFRPTTRRPCQRRYHPALRPPPRGSQAPHR